MTSPSEKPEMRDEAFYNKIMWAYVALFMFVIVALFITYLWLGNPFDLTRPGLTSRI